MAFDYFVAGLRCPACGKVSAPDGTTNMQTKIRDEAELAYLGVGARVDGTARNLERSGYLEIRAPEEGECRLLHAWECASCGRPFNWAVVTIREGSIRDISAAEMGPAVLSSAHCIGEFDARMLAATLTGLPSSEFSPADALAALRRAAK